MKRSIFILASALVIFMVTLFVTNNYMNKETVHEADIANDLQIQDVKRQMDLNLLVREKAVHSFLSGIFYYDIKEKNGRSDTLIYISDYEFPRFKNYVYESLNDFVKLNPHTQCATFLIDPSVYPEKGEDGFAPLIEQNDTIHKNLAGRYDFLHSKSYQEVIKTGHCRWTIPSKNSPRYGQSIIYYVPIRRQNGSIFGAFAINVSIDVLRNGLTETLPYGEDNSFILTVDNNDNIIFSTNKFQDRFSKISDYTAFLKKEDRAGGEAGESGRGAVRDVVTWMGQDYFVYRNCLSHAPWQIITVCSKKAIYDNVTKTRNIIFIVSAIGMLLMLICCVVVFRQVKNQLAQKAAAQEEIKLAANVQQSLLKAPVLNTDNYQMDAFMRPAREAGGDLYDYVEKDGKLIFCIGDVSGKGMPAALFMTQVVSLFRNACTFSDQPDQMVSQMNDVLADNNPNMTFCTLFLGVIDKENNTLTFCNAGHNRPVMTHSAAPSDSPKGEGKEHRPYFLQVKPNIALGLMSGYPYQSETINLSEGDTIILYTDGVTEAKNAAHAQFGDDALLNIATTPLTSHIVHSVDHFVNGYEQSDDITVMTIHHKS